MNFLHVIDSIDPREGGLSAGVRYLAEAAAKTGDRTAVASTDAPGSFDSRGLPFEWFPLGPCHLGRYAYSPRLVPWLRAHASIYDAVLIHGIWGYSHAAAWRAWKGIQPPRLVFPHGMLDPWFKRTHPFRHIKKWFYWPWGAHPALRDAAAVCFTSERERILARQSFWLYKANEAVVGMGVTDPPPANPLQTEAFYQCAPEVQGKRVVLFLSRLHSKKGCDLLLRAFASVLANDPSWRLVMAGPGNDDYVVKLKNIARQLGIANSVSWPGMLEGDAKWGAFRAADVFCLPSHQENFGLAAAEAMSCGCPVLVSDQVNIVSEIIASAAGMAALDTLEGTQQLLTRWRCVSADERHTYARNALRCQREKFDARTTVENIRQLVEKIRSQQ